MDGSELVFILMPIVIPLFLALGIAAPYIADSRANKRRHVHKKESSHHDIRQLRKLISCPVWFVRRGEKLVMGGGYAVVRVAGLPLLRQDCQDW